MQHHLSEVIRQIDQGQTVLVTRRNRVIAQLGPPPASAERKIRWPDFVARARANKVKGPPLSRTIIEERSA